MNRVKQFWPAFVFLTVGVLYIHEAVVKPAVAGTSLSTPFLKAGEVAVTGGMVYYDIDPICYHFAVTGAQTDAVIAKIPTPTTYTVTQYKYENPETKTYTTLTYPANGKTMRYWYGRPRAQVNAAPGAGKNLQIKLQARCINSAATDVLADVWVKTTATYAESPEVLCQDSAYADFVNVTYTSTSGITTASADVCFDKFTVIDPCSGTDTESTCVQ